MHSVARAEKILTFMTLTGEYWQQKHTQHAPSTNTECDYLNGWIKKKKKKKKPVTYSKISPKMLNPKDIAGERRRRMHEMKPSVQIRPCQGNEQSLVQTHRVCGPESLSGQITQQPTSRVSNVLGASQRLSAMR